MQQPITERVNELTKNLDVVGPRGIVRLLRQSDSQIFSGWEEWEGLCDAPNLHALESLVYALQPLIHKKKNGTNQCNVRFIMSGAGTSGRLAFYCARTLNKISQSVNANIRFDYLMAGHDLALIKSQEKAEDDVVQSVQDLKSITDDDENCSHAIYFGITCGLSAPYVGSQIDWILNAPHPPHIAFTTVLVGFNHTSMGRKTPIEGFNKTMNDIIQQLQSKIGDSKHFILNPIVGPEPVAGSSRMKGGSVTKLLVEVIAAKLLHGAFKEELPLIPDYLQNCRQLNYDDSIPSLIETYERINRWTYIPESEIAEVVSRAADCLKNEGHVYYLGEDSLSIIALIDASECPPTYGAQFSDIRGFVPGGWGTMDNLEGDMSSHGTNYQISHLDFEKNIIPTLSANDLLIILHESSQSTDRLIHLINASKATCSQVGLAIISWDQNGKVNSKLAQAAQQSDSKTTIVSVKLPFHQLLPNWFAPVEISAKWICNSISTGAHILKGKVWQNRMIDLNLSNDKLYRRGIALVSQILKTTETQSIEAILKAIYQVDVIDDKIRSYPISNHCQEACKHQKVIPIAILLASGKFETLEHAKQALNKEPIIRNIIEQILNNKS